MRSATPAVAASAAARSRAVADTSTAVTRQLWRGGPVVLPPSPPPRARAVPGRRLPTTSTRRGSASRSTRVRAGGNGPPRTARPPRRRGLLDALREVRCSTLRLLPFALLLCCFVLRAVPRVDGRRTT